MSKSRIKIKTGQKESNNNKKNTLASRKAKKDKSNCPLIEEEVIKNCDCCRLKIICVEIDKEFNKVR